MISDDECIEIDFIEDDWNPGYINFVTKNLYPGAKLTYKVAVTNVGTVPVEISKAKGFKLPENFILEEYTFYKDSEQVSYNELYRLDPEEEGVVEVVIMLNPKLKGDEFENATIKDRMAITFTQFNDPAGWVK